MGSRWHIQVSVALLLILLVVAGVEAASERVLILEANALVVREIATGVSVASVELDGTPDVVVLTPGARHAVVLDVIANTKQSEAASITIVDLAAMRVLGRVDLKGDPPLTTGLYGLDSRVWRLEDIAESIRRWITPDGRWLVIPFDGVEGPQPEQRARPELVVVNLESGKPAGVVPLERGAAGVYVSPNSPKALVFWKPLTPKKGPAIPAEAAILDFPSATMSPRVALVGEDHDIFTPRLGSTSIIFSKRLQPKHGRPVPASLQLIDLATGQASSSLELDGTPGSATLSPDDQYLYLLDHGSKNVNGRLLVYSVGKGLVTATEPVGSNPRGLVGDPEGSQVFLLSSTTPRRSTAPVAGELRVLRDGRVVKTVSVAADPEKLHISDSRDRLFVIAQDAVTIVNLASLEALGQVPLDRPRYSVLVGFDATSDGKRAFALFWDKSPNRLSVLDGVSYRHIASVSIGRGAGKLLRAFAEAWGVAGERRPYPGSVSPGDGYAGLRPRKTDRYRLALRNDGKFAYVLNFLTHDITLVDTDNGTSPGRIAASGRSIAMLPGGNRLAVLGDNAVLLIDTETNRDAVTLKFEAEVDHGLWLVCSVDGHDALALGPRNGFFINTQTGQTHAALEFKAEVRHVVLLPGPGR